MLLFWQQVLKGREIIEKKLNIYIASTIVFGSIIKIFYAWTRDIFPSGPDANGFIPVAENFWKFGFFSESVDLPNIYSAGYPYFLSFIFGIFDSNWYQAAQLIQIILFGVGTFLFAKSIIRMNFRLSALLFTIILNSHLAWVAATSMAMYETLLFFLLSLVVYLTVLNLFPVRNNSNLTSGFLFGLTFGLLGLVHPRGLLFCTPFLLAVVLFTHKRLLFVSSFSASTLPIVWATMHRTSRDSGDFNFGGNVWASSSWGRDSIDACATMMCTVNSWVDKPLTNINYLFENASRFFTPYSGPAVKGTWFHNLSGQYLLWKNGHLPLSLNLSHLLMFSSIFIFFYFLLSVFRKFRSLERSVRLVVIATLSSLGLMLLTSAFTFGDSRHRLLAVPLLYTIIVISFGLMSRVHAGRVK